MYASPRVRDTALAPQRLCRPRRHPCKGKREVQLSCRSWSNLPVRLGPFLENSCPHASFELQQRHPPCACESSCMLLRLLPWRDVAAEYPARGLLNAVLVLSSSPSVCQTCILLIETALHYIKLSIESFFKKSLYVRQRGLVRPKFFLMGDGAIALEDSLTPLPWHNRVNLDVEDH